MRILRHLLWIALLSSCAVEKKGILVDVEPGTPMDESDLHQHCDLGDRAACVLSDDDDSHAPPPSLSLIQGVAPPDRATFTVLEQKNRPLFWYIYDKELSHLTKLFTVKAISRGDSAYAIQRLDARGLLAEHHYELLGGDKDGTLVEARRFHPLLTEEQPLKAEVITGWRMATHDARLALLSAAHARKPQFLILAGSALDATIPADRADIKGRASRDLYFARHAAARSNFELGFERELLPVAVLWNEDEYGRANGDGSFPQRDEAREMMELFFPHWADETSIVNGPGISLTLDFHPFELALVDDLSFRLPPTGGTPVCHAVKGHKHEVCKPGKFIAPPPGSRHGSLLRNWITSRSTKAGRPLWLLTGGPHLFPYSADWNQQAVLDDPALSRTPAHAALWEISAERGQPATLTQLP
jgi:hypothetical protein